MPFALFRHCSAAAASLSGHQVAIFSAWEKSDARPPLCRRREASASIYWLLLTDLVDEIEPCPADIGELRGGLLSAQQK